MKNQNQNREPWMRDYPELEGKIIPAYDEGRTFRNVLVVGCNYDIGITLVVADNHEKYHYCIPGELSPVKQRFWTQEEYDRKFYRYCSQLQAGFFNFFSSSPSWSNNHEKPSASTCSFGQ